MLCASPFSGLLLTLLQKKQDVLERGHCVRELVHSDLCAKIASNPEFDTTAHAQYVESLPVSLLSGFEAIFSDFVWLYTCGWC
jgi:hypothetical protein